MAFDVKNFFKLSKKIVGAALNYRSVVVERKLTIPNEPVVFLKPTTSYIEEGQPIKLPDDFEVNHEVELGVVIGRRCRNLKPEDVSKVIGGYCVALDLTAVNVLRLARATGNSWTLAKGFDTSCPVSSVLPVEKVCKPDDIRVWCTINGKAKQDCSTSDMIFSSNNLISYISKYITLEPYDLILTGTPSGSNGIAKGDVIKIGLDDILTAEFSVAEC